MSRHRRSLALLGTCLAASFVTTCGATSAAPLSYTPDLAHNSVSLEGLIPTKQFMNITLPKGSIEFTDGMLAVNIIPNWNFDRVPVLEGPIIRTEATTSGNEALISGVALFTDGEWFDKYWTPGSHETVVTNAGLTVEGKISDLTQTTLTVTATDGTATIVPLADVKELHSPRAYAFLVPARAGSPLTPEQSWTADVQAVTLAATVGTGATPRLSSVRRDPLLSTRDDGDWSNRKMIVIGTALSLLEAAQFTPELVLPMFSHQLYVHGLKKSFFTNTHPFPPVVAPLINGNTYSLPVPFNATH